MSPNVGGATAELRLPDPLAMSASLLPQRGNLPAFEPRRQKSFVRRLLTDHQILAVHYDVIAGQEQSRDWDNTVIDIPPGKPQIKLNRHSGQWVPQGDCFAALSKATPRGT